MESNSIEQKSYENLFENFEKTKETSFESDTNTHIHSNTMLNSSKELTINEESLNLDDNLDDIYQRAELELELAQQRLLKVKEALLSKGKVISSNNQINSFTSFPITTTTIDTIGPLVDIENHTNLTHPIQLNIKGFIGVAKLLQRIFPINVYMTVGGSTNIDEWIERGGNPCFCYPDNPITGWKREIIVRMSGRTIGHTEVVYVSPQQNKRIRNKNDLIAYFNKYDISMTLLPKFSFHGVSCICHSSDNSSNIHLECSFGLCGCRQWLHPKCVCLDPLMTKVQIQELDAMICPFCVAYLEELNEIELYGKNKKLLRNISLASTSSNSSIAINNKVFEECARPHYFYGIDNMTSKLKYPNEDYHFHSKTTIGMKRGRSRRLIDVDTIASQPVASSSSSSSNSNVNMITSTSSGIFQHVLFQFQQYTTTCKDMTYLSSISDIPIDHPITTIIPDIDIPLEDPLPTYDDTVPLNERKRFARYPTGELVTVMLEGGCTTPMTSWKFMNYQVFNSFNENEDITTITTITTITDEIYSRVTEKRRQLLQEALDHQIALDIYTKFKRELMNQISFRANTTKISIDDMNLMLLPLEDGSIKLGFIHPNTNTNNILSTSSSLHMFCMKGELCAFCLEEMNGFNTTTCDIIETTRTMTMTRKDKMIESNQLVKPKKGKRKSKREDKSQVLISDVLKQRIQRLEDGYDDEHVTLTDDDIEDDNEEELIDVNVLNSSFDLGCVSYSLHPWCIYALKTMNIQDLIILLNLHHPAIEIKYINNTIKFYHYDHIDDAQCDICGRRGGIMIEYQMNKEYSSLPSPSDDGWLGHIPCLTYLIQSGILSNTLSNILSMNTFDEMNNFSPCAICGICLGITMKCATITCSIRVHPICMKLAKNQDYEMFQINNANTNDNIALICLCPLHKTIMNTCN